MKVKIVRESTSLVGRTGVSLVLIALIFTKSLSAVLPMEAGEVRLRDFAV